MDEAVTADRAPATKHLRIADHLRIYWRHRRVGHPRVNALRVTFDRIIAANEWNLARNFDELIDRYANLYR
ncbi:MAG: hypothetical protein KJN63_08465 [Acidimicrobiia bacterium]|nr:hypothetical protein [Acidimicrobiia bacterium]